MNQKPTHTSSILTLGVLGVLPGVLLQITNVIRPHTWMQTASSILIIWSFLSFLALASLVTGRTKRKEIRRYATKLAFLKYLTLSSLLPLIGISSALITLTKNPIAITSSLVALVLCIYFCLKTSRDLKTLPSYSPDSAIPQEEKGI